MSTTPPAPSPPPPPPAKTIPRYGAARDWASFQAAFVQVVATGDQLKQRVEGLWGAVADYQPADLAQSFGIDLPTAQWFYTAIQTYSAAVAQANTVLADTAAQVRSITT